MNYRTRDMLLVLLYILGMLAAYILGSLNN
jgi:hypothetical protein